MASIGNISTTTKEAISPNLIPIDESVCGLMFDVAGWHGLFPDESVQKNRLQNGVVSINNIAEAEKYGIVESFMCGIPHYHLSQYYQYLGYDKEIFVSFPDLSSSESAFDEMIMESGCSIFQIGVWSIQPMFSIYGDKSIFSSFVTKIHSQVSAINGTHEEPSGYPSGVSVILCGGTWYDNAITTMLDHASLPDCKEVNYLNISILIGQDSTEEVHGMMDNMSYPSQVGMIGKVMACLSMCGAEESIAFVQNYNLNKDDDISDIELGFGINYSPISSINSIRRNVLINKGYIFPSTYEAKEGGVFLSCDDTMSDGDYNTISQNRVIHKFKRVVKRVLVPMVNDRAMMRNDLRYLDSAYVTELNNALSEAINEYMLNSKGQKQVYEYYIEIDDEQDEMNNDKLKLVCRIATHKNQNQITEEIE